MIMDNDMMELIKNLNSRSSLLEMQLELKEKELESLHTLVMELNNYVDKRFDLFSRMIDVISKKEE